MYTTFTFIHLASCWRINSNYYDQIGNGTVSNKKRFLLTVLVSYSNALAILIIPQNWLAGSSRKSYWLVTYFIKYFNLQIYILQMKIRLENLQKYVSYLLCVLCELGAPTGAE